MKIGIIGLGLIGGSMAKAIKQTGGHEVIGTDIQESVVRRALLLESIDGRLTNSGLSECEMVIIALYPGETVRFISEKGNLLRKGSVVLDCCGIKQSVCRKIRPAASELGFHFIGAHPMAGIEFFGFEYSKGSLFNGASMILTPPGDLDIRITEQLKHFFLSIGFGHIEITTPEKHDKVIAYTSQLAHVVSNAYVKSPRAEMHKGFSAGSYLDLTRVAKLNPDMWTELFLENREFLTDEIDGLIQRLELYKNAIQNGRHQELHKLLDEGTKRKIMLDGE
ncbi:MAG TPA: prephenate dehydrogenase/arogenate dehydrogenase family protein [Bacillota bacterium]|jgi:prephenate dehydrogenase|nr:prephenate dehydrogenase/arogenate dehydrogenase family protein [Bacillota bacterium]